MENKYDGVAALTIVSKNYISLARVLSESFLQHHPGAKFFVVLVDKNDGMLNPEEETFELYEMTDVDLPNLEVFPYQYNILELNTAVKPFALRWLMDTVPGLKKLAYIDPDIMVCDELLEVWGGLDDHSVTLTPHMREPFDDDASPTELNILQSGTYNLGFIGLKNNADGRKLLDWWCERLYLNCVVDIPRGLFTDQKWIDLVPGYFESTKIIHNPAYNVAYWNLHERELEYKDNQYYVENDHLRFFHFSGYDPRKPEVLSKHQSRHQFEDLPVVEKLYGEYASKLFTADIVATKKWSFAYSYLPNEVKLNDAIHRVIRQCLQDNIPFPSIADDLEGFCKFLMTPSRAVFGADVAPIVTAILTIRPDVANVFPNATHDKHDEGFLAWLNHNGIEELELHQLLASYGQYLTKDNAVKLLIDIYYEREDVQAVYPGAFQNYERLDKTATEWFSSSAIAEYDAVEQADVDRLIAAKTGVYKILSLYAGRADLQKVFHNIQTHEGIDKFYGWLLDELKTLNNISEDEIHLFYAWAKVNGATLQKFSLTYNSVIRNLVGGIPSIFNIDNVTNSLFVHGLPYHEEEIAHWLIHDHDWSLVDQLVATASQHAELTKNLSIEGLDVAQIKELLTHRQIDNIVSKYNLRDKITEALNSINFDQKKINVAGYFSASTGMGQSARSMQQIIESSNDIFVGYTLPEVYIGENEYIEIPENGFVFGLPSPLAKQSIVIANADATPAVQSLLPKELQLTSKIGYWVWETEVLPAKWAKNADYYDEIWSASQYSAKAIETTINKKVKIEPHVINQADLPPKKVSRKAFELPTKSFLFGYFFDQKSISERKNPKAVIDAFRTAFGNRKDVALVLKVNTPKPGEYHFSRLKSYAKDVNVIWVEKTFNRKDTLALMSCLDCYISLHRSEGFGLTMAEALMMDIPVIATNYSGNVDFMTTENSYLVDYELVKTKKRFGAYPAGTIWAEPSIQDAAKNMACLFDNRSKNIFDILNSSNMKLDVESRKVIDSLSKMV
ncbi:MAG: glycosyltransferase [Cellvibrionales bacterium]|nr:glycosyltransferase [Cellvibrionales bacterium]